MGELSSSLPDELNFLLRGRAPGKRQIKPVSYEKAEASLAWVKTICGDDDDDDADEELLPMTGNKLEDAEGSQEDEDDGEEEDYESDDDENVGDEEESNNGLDDEVDAGSSENHIRSEPSAKPSEASEDSSEKVSLPAGLSFLLKSRAPGKRKVKPVSAEKAAMLADFGGSDDDDEDFNFSGNAMEEDEDANSSHFEDSDSSYSPEKKKTAKKGKPMTMDSDVEITKEERIPVHIDLDSIDSSISSKPTLDVAIKSGPRLETLVCFVCLKEYNDDKDNELVQCDGCGIACHVLCYGIGELSDDGDESGRSTPLSTASTEPWFCDSCRAVGGKPTCQLCPNEGGAFKQTDSGQWVHLICALYTGCSFGEVSGLTKVNVNTIKQKRWGSRICSLCPDPQFASTGVCISCDAGMCKMIFHVTCAQREGLLAEAPVAVAASVLSSSMNSPIKIPKTHRDDYSSDEDKKKKRKHDAASQEAADPFYACCKRHSNPESTKRNKRNCLAAFRICATFKQEDRWELAIGRDRYERKLVSAREKFDIRTRKQIRAFEVSVTASLCYQSRPVTSCPQFLKRAAMKAKLGGVDEEHFVMSPTFNNSAAVSSSHYAPLSFTSRFVQYFEARNKRIDELRAICSSNESQQKDAAREENDLKKTYDVLFQSVRRHRDQGDRHCAEVAEIHSCITELLKKYFNTGEDKSNANFNFTVPELPTELTVAQDRKKFETELKETAGITMYECNRCKQTRDQHMLMECGTCHRHFHCFCLDPPLSQPWTGSKNSSRRSSAKWAWECHFCCPSSSDGDVVKKDINVDAPRQLRREIKAPVRFIVTSEQPENSAQSGASSSKEESKPSNGSRNNCYTNKGNKGGRKRSRGAAESTNESPVPKVGKGNSPAKAPTTPPLKLVIPAIAVAALNKSPPKPVNPAVYDFSSESNQ